MNAIELMMEEHRHIKRVLGSVRKLCIGIMNGNEVNYRAFEMVIDFVRNYADRHHHNKEEEILFKKMSEELGEVVKNGPIFGMLSEHDLGRLFILNLEHALQRVKNGDQDSKVDIIANAIAYTDLLHRHIEKEDTAIYIFGQNKLRPETLKEVEDQCEEVERQALQDRIQEKYLNMVDELEKISRAHE